MRTTILIATLVGSGLLNAACLADVGGEDCLGPRCKAGSGSGSGSDAGSAASGTCTDPEEVLQPLTIRGEADFAGLPEGCWSLNATLRLEGPGVITLAGLGQLIEVNDLEIVDTALTSITTRTTIKVWGSLLVSGNAKLANLNNLAVKRWDGATADGVPFAVAYVIRNNPVLTALDGLRYIARVDRDLRITDNAQLPLIDLPELATVNGALQISNTAVTAIRIASLATLGGDLIVRANPQLATIATMSSLARIGGALTIDDNDALAELGGLTTQLNQVGGALAITNNARLASVGRLGRMTTGIGSTVTITGNPQLPQCAAIEVDHCVLGGTAIVQNNLAQANCSCWCGQ